MGTDRELLERAAKAAGHEWQWLGCNFVIRRPDLLWDSWAPLTDDGDALRLAVRLRLEVNGWGAGACAVVRSPTGLIITEAHYGDDPERATRRAIVRAAAAMPEGGQV